MNSSEPIGSGTDDVSFMQIPLTGIIVEGYKSIHGRTELALKPLTILAGRNSSGKSSAIQPMLLLKQTLEAVYDPGPLLLDGPNVRLSSTDQMLSRGPNEPTHRCVIGLRFGDGGIESEFAVSDANDLVLTETRYLSDGSDPLRIHEEMTKDEIMAGLPEEIRDASVMLPGLLSSSSEVIAEFAKDFGLTFQWTSTRHRCFWGISPMNRSPIPMLPPPMILDFVRDIIHIPASRGNSERLFKTAAVGTTFPGTFDHYVASIVTHWQRTGNKKAIGSVGDALRQLDLTWAIRAQPLSHAQVELQVPRSSTPGGGADDFVSIADVGVGVSQILPLLVALEVAHENQTVYVEEPELHLHPNAQWKLADVFANALGRGVRLIVETHSGILLRGLQTAVARKAVAAENVQLHWFDRDQQGLTEVTEGSLDQAGRYYDWPVDFDDLILASESDFLDAVEEATHH